MNNMNTNRSYITKVNNGLAIYNKTWDDFKKAEHIGGSSASGKKQWDLLKDDNDVAPPITTMCVCGKNNIAENCYIKFEDGLILVIGNNCVRQFWKTGIRNAEKIRYEYRYNMMIDHPIKYRNRLVHTVANKPPDPVKYEYDYKLPDPEYDYKLPTYIPKEYSDQSVEAALDLRERRMMIYR